MTWELPPDSRAITHAANEPPGSVTTATSGCTVLRAAGPSRPGAAGIFAGLAGTFSTWQSAGPDPGKAAQQPSYGAQLDWPPAAMALANTWFCSATLAWPKSAGLPPYSAQVEALN